jgi:hypothetical protein
MDNETNTMVDLYGLLTEPTRCMREQTTSRTRVATFSTRELAEEYVKASTLKSYSDLWRDRTRFRAISLLRYYNDYEIETHENLGVPHNPTINEI